MTILALQPPVRAIARKELRELRRHRMIVLTAAILPIVFLILPVLNLLFYNAVRTVGGPDFAVGQAMFLFFLTPVIMPATMAAYSIIGERDQGTLEPLLTLPLTDRQLLAGKVLAILLPTLAISFGIFAIYMAIVAVAVEEPVRTPALHWTWPFGLLVTAPLLALFSTLTGLFFSARSKDVRVAEHLSGLVLLPSMLPVLLIVTRTIDPSPLNWLVFAASAALVNAFLWRTVVRAFDRERAISTI
jgi:ABC-2 type transport system permease protein